MVHTFMGHWLKVFSHLIWHVLMEGSKIYFLVGGTFLYRFGVAFDRQLIPMICRTSYEDDVVSTQIRSTFLPWSICFLDSWQQQPVRKGPWGLQGYLRSQPLPSSQQSSPCKRFVNIFILLLWQQQGLPFFPPSPLLLLLRCPSCLSFSSPRSPGVINSS